MTAFIDLHVHPPVPELLEGAFAPFLASAGERFGRPIEPMTSDEIADHYRARNGRAVLLAWDAQSATGRVPFSSSAVAAMVAAHPDVFMGFGSVDPQKGAAALAGAHEAKRLGMLGLKFHPQVQRFSPADRRVYPIWEVAQQLGLVVLIHTGFTAMGAGLPGGGGVTLETGNPMLLDQVAVDFPDLQIVLAHPSWPWQEEAIAVAEHKSNVWLELSGWSPLRMPEQLLEAVRGRLADRTLFGSDFPFLTPDKWLKDWDQLGMPAEVSEQVLVANARRLLRLEG